jgi:hypothetical protein
LNHGATADLKAATSDLSAQSRTTQRTRFEFTRRLDPDQRLPDRRALQAADVQPRVEPPRQPVNNGIDISNENRQKEIL